MYIWKFWTITTLLDLNRKHTVKKIRAPNLLRAIILTWSNSRNYSPVLLTTCVSICIDLKYPYLSQFYFNVLRGSPVRCPITWSYKSTRLKSINHNFWLADLILRKLLDLLLIFFGTTTKFKGKFWFFHTVLLMPNSPANSYILVKRYNLAVRLWKPALVTWLPTCSHVSCSLSFKFG